MVTCKKLFLEAKAYESLTENSPLKLVTAVVMLPRPWAISYGRCQDTPATLNGGLRYTHEAADREVQDVQIADDRAEGGRRGRKRLDGGDDHVGALGHGADRAEEDDGDKRDELAEELHGEMRIGGCWEAALKSFVGLLSS